MTETEFIARYLEECPMYTAWGNFVAGAINQSLLDKLEGKALVDFLKLPVAPRLKDSSSLVNKAFYSTKNYKNPYDDITDKIGLRFVVLLPKEIDFVSEIIIGNKSWSYSKDRDFEAERLANPMVFTYQSTHFVVKALDELSFEGVTILRGTPCEIQVRTILQHAYSELTHDTIYKPKIIATPTIHRTIAKSMALIEATDGFFSEVDMEIDRLSKQDKPISDFLSGLYERYVGVSPSKDKVNELIIDSFRDLHLADATEAIDNLLNEKAYIKEKILGRRDGNHLFRQSVMPLLYFLASSYPEQTKERWPLTPDELRPIFLDMGLSFDEG